MLPNDGLSGYISSLLRWKLEFPCGDLIDELLSTNEESVNLLKNLSIMSNLLCSLNIGLRVSVFWPETSQGWSDFSTESIESDCRTVNYTHCVFVSKNTGHFCDIFETNGSKHSSWSAQRICDVVSTEFLYTYSSDFFIEFISLSVMKAFMVASSITIAASQVKVCQNYWRRSRGGPGVLTPPFC
jgi:hypothetical protein